MDWQVIILTLGAALITGLTSVIGNILVVRSSLRKSVQESNEQKQKEFMAIRLKAYEDVLIILHDIDESNDEQELIQACLRLQNQWLDKFLYISKNLNHELH